MTPQTTSTLYMAESDLNMTNTLLKPDLSELFSLSLEGLKPMLDPETRLFCYKLLKTETGLVRQGLSPRYTIMTLLGLRCLEKTGAPTGFDTNDLFERLVSDSKWIQGAGDLGLLLWLVAYFAPERLDALCKDWDLKNAVERYEDGRKRSTTELAWFLAGLSHAVLASKAVAGQVEQVAAETLKILLRNQGASGFFGHLSTDKSLAGMVRGRIGSFADQIYPVYALAKYGTAFGGTESFAASKRCADAICRVQGKFGQWWWLYDSKTGRISSQYPVYSVHQQGMAPMGLFALQEATGADYSKSIYKGLRWIYGENELGTDIRDLKSNLIWRCVLPKNSQKKYWDTAMSLVRNQEPDTPAGPLTILYEDRPYELGWLLYAFAGKSVPSGI